MFDEWDAEEERLEAIEEAERTKRLKREVLESIRDIERNLDRAEAELGMAEFWQGAAHRIETCESVEGILDALGEIHGGALEDERDKRRVTEKKLAEAQDLKGLLTSIGQKAEEAASASGELLADVRKRKEKQRRLGREFAPKSQDSKEAKDALRNLLKRWMVERPERKTWSQQRLIEAAIEEINGKVAGKRLHYHWQAYRKLVPRCKRRGGGRGGM